ncbi:MAG TPA: CVNH domain-containing protein, partial [Candidatus Limnocylindrales bacterium]|nr:CVNH domain-containing protein [Candidatus Limnocylindrales bacterium]
LVLIMFGICMFAAWGTAAHAQGLPQGSYLQTCNNVSVNGDTLVATCQAANGALVNTQLPGFQNCQGEVINDNGNLRCNMAGGYGYGQPVGTYGAGGPFTQTCRSVRYKGDDLHATCEATDGSWHETKLDDYRKCRGTIINDNGNLRCAAGVSYGAPVGGYQGAYGGYQGVNGPAGSYLQTCQDVHVSGNDLRARCVTRDNRQRDARLDDYRSCRGDIVNDDGHLRCASGAPVGGYYGNGPYGVAGAPGALNGPNGSYARTCSDIHVSGDDLKARCQTADGGLHDTKLDDYRKCHSDIINDNGNLRCQR